MKKTSLLTMTMVITVLASASAANPPEAIKQIWSKECAKCHGTEGKADTKMGKKIGAIDFTDPQKQAKFTDEQMFKTIKEGVKDQQGKITMKPFGEVLKVDEINEMIAFIRAFKK